MPAIILDGKGLAKKIKLDLANQVEKLPTKPGLAVVLIGDDPASELYIKLKEKAAKEIGITFHKYICNNKCCKDSTEHDIIEMIKFLNKDKAVNGILVQLPLPEKFNTDKILKAVKPSKDVDGFIRSDDKLIPPTIGAIIELLKSTNEDLKDKEAIILAKSDIFTKNLKKYLKGITKISKIKLESKLPKSLKKFSVVISAIGEPHSIKKSMIKKDAIIIDVGISILGKNTLGDVDPNVSEVASYLSPVPGGVGPLTVAVLMKNVVELIK
jgi:methylenetetrahydrofolate dehydrogenase (NADP+) / methenyltetrahydrofolate cyclohydrolase